MENYHKIEEILGFRDDSRQTFRAGKQGDLALLDLFLSHSGSRTGAADRGHRISHMIEDGDRHTDETIF